MKSLSILSKPQWKLLIYSGIIFGLTLYANKPDDKTWAVPLNVPMARLMIGEGRCLQATDSLYLPVFNPLSITVDDL